MTSSILASQSWQTPAVAGYRDLTQRARSNIDSLLPPISYLRDDSDDTPTAIRRLRISWQQKAIPLLDAIDAQLVTLAQALNGVLGDDSRTVEYRQTELARVATGAAQSLTSTGQQLGEVCRQILDRARAAALPARPQPADTLQETRIAGLKSDLQMLMSNLRADYPERDFVDRLSKRLTASLAAGDGLAVWLLCSTWPTEFLAASLGLDDAVVCALWEQSVTDDLAAGSPTARGAIDLFRALDSTRDGLPVLIAVTGGFLRTVLDDVVGFVRRNR